MSLEQYQKKRKFSETPEPEGKLKNSGKKTIFVIQKHQASHLHYDLRLEISGVLRSWAVPKGPPEEKGVKRLAVLVEDHPIEYAKFHGEIPEGNYGAGKVEIWDSGTYEMDSEGAEKIVFVLHGKKLKGKYVLLKINYGTTPGKNWLWFKTEDEKI